MKKYRIETDGKNYRICEKSLFFWRVSGNKSNYHGKRCFVPYIYYSIENAEDKIKRMIESDKKEKWKIIKYFK